MPNRILRETILTSRAVNKLTAEEEVFYRRLMSIVDDWGRHEADLEILLPRVYPLQLDRHTTVTCGQLLSRVSHVTATDGQPLVLVYEVDGHKYLEISHFHQRTRAKQSRCPSPDRHTAVMRPPDDSHTTANVRLDGDVFGDVIEDGDGGDSPLPPSPTKTPTAELTRADRIPIPEPGVFDVQAGWREFSEAYPVQVGSDAAARWYISLMTKREPPNQVQLQVEIMAGLHCWTNSARWRHKETGELELKFIPSMDKFLGVPKESDPTRGKMYLDHPAPWEPRTDHQADADKGAYLRGKIQGGDDEAAGGK